MSSSAFSFEMNETFLVDYYYIYFVVFTLFSNWRDDQYQCDCYSGQLLLVACAAIGPSEKRTRDKRSICIRICRDLPSRVVSRQSSSPVSFGWFGRLGKAGRVRPKSFRWFFVGFIWRPSWAASESRAWLSCDRPFTDSSTISTTSQHRCPLQRKPSFHRTTNPFFFVS